MSSELHFSRESIITYLEQHPAISQEEDTYLGDKKIIETVANFFADKDMTSTGIDAGMNVLMAKIGKGLNLDIAGMVTIEMSLTRALTQVHQFP